jgi:hypothetical protein
LGETSLFSDYSSVASAPTNLGTLASNHNTWVWSGTTRAIQSSAYPCFVSVTASGTITEGSFSGPLVGNSTGTHTGAVVGNASTATKLATSRSINGIEFDGLNDITVPASAETLTGTTLKNTVTSSNLTAVGVLNNLTVTGAVNTSGGNRFGPGAGGGGSLLLVFPNQKIRDLALEKTLPKKDWIWIPLSCETQGLF